MIVDPFPNASDDDGNMRIFVDRFLRRASGTRCYEARNSADKAVIARTRISRFCLEGVAKVENPFYEKSLALTALRKRVFVRNSSIREDAGDRFRIE